MPPRPRRALRGDRAGVTEIIGYILVFGILSVILVLSMSAFTVAQDAARARAAESRAESAAARVGGVIVQTAVLIEQQGNSAAIAYRIDLPDDLEGLPYTVKIEAATGAAGCTPSPTCTPDQVRVKVPAVNVDVTAPVFSAAAPANIDLCTIQVAGGPLYVRVNVPTDGTHPLPAGCANAGGIPKIFLEATS